MFVRISEYKTYRRLCIPNTEGRLLIIVKMLTTKQISRRWAEYPKTKCIVGCVSQYRGKNSLITMKERTTKRRLRLVGRISENKTYRRLYIQNTGGKLLITVKRRTTKQRYRPVGRISTNKMHHLLCIPKQEEHRTMLWGYAGFPAERFHLISVKRWLLGCKPSGRDIVKIYIYRRSL